MWLMQYLCVSALFPRGFLSPKTKAGLGSKSTQEVAETAADAREGEGARAGRCRGSRRGEWRGAEVAGRGSSLLIVMVVMVMMVMVRRRRALALPRSLRSAGRSVRLLRRASRRGLLTKRILSVGLLPHLQRLTLLLIRILLLVLLVRILLLALAFALHDAHHQAHDHAEEHLHHLLFALRHLLAARLCLVAIRRLTAHLLRLLLRQSRACEGEHSRNSSHDKRSSPDIRTGVWPVAFVLVADPVRAVWSGFNTASLALIIAWGQGAKQDTRC